MATPKASSVLLGLFGLLVVIIILALAKDTFRPKEGPAEVPTVTTEARGGGEAEPELASPQAAENERSPAETLPTAPGPTSSGAIAGKAYSTSDYGINFRYPDSWSVSEEKNPSRPKYLHVSIGSLDQTGSPGLDLFLNDLGRSFEGYSEVVSEGKERKLGGALATETILDDPGAGRRATFLKLVTPKGDNLLLAFSHGKEVDYSRELNSIVNTWRFD